METTCHFLYANDLVITTQGKTFSEVTLTHALEKLDRYNTQNSLKLNQEKMQVNVFNLNNNQARKEQERKRSINLEHTQTPIFLGVTLDRTLIFKSNCDKLNK